jgi:DNA-binding NarL/FixJ family response regulator
MIASGSTLSAPYPCHHEPHYHEPAQIRVMIVDDHPAIRLGLQALLDDQPDILVVAQARTAGEALSRLDSLVDVAVIDYHLRDSRDGLALVALIRERRAATRTLVYSAFADAALAAMALIAGADGMLGKHELGDELCNAIRRVARGQRHVPAIPPAVAGAMRSRLDPGDRAIVGMLLHGVAPATVAASLAITTQQLAIRRAEILRSLRPSRIAPPGFAQTTAPLDYERPKRRLSRAPL